MRWGSYVGGLTTKVHLDTDRHRFPLSAIVMPGQRRDSTQYETALDAVASRQASDQTHPRLGRSSPTAGAMSVASAAGGAEEGSGPCFPQSVTVLVGWATTVRRIESEMRWCERWATSRSIGGS